MLKYGLVTLDTNKNNQILQITQENGVNLVPFCLIGVVRLVGRFPLI